MKKRNIFVTFFSRIIFLFTGYYTSLGIYFFRIRNIQMIDRCVAIQ